jgi:hypothetical protein
MTRATVLSLLTAALIAPSVEELPSPVPGMSMALFLSCLNDKQISKSNELNVISPLKDKPPIPSSMPLECSGDLSGNPLIK